MTTRIDRRSRLALTTVLTLACLASAAWAQKGGKGGGGGGGGGSQNPPPPKPSASYEVDVLDIPGMTGLADVNDAGVCVISVRVSEVTDPILTTRSGAAAIFDTRTGEIAYLDNLIPADLPWDLDGGFLELDINNRGQILGRGIKYQGGSLERRTYLLNPDGAGYDLIDLGIDGVGLQPVSLTESGDVLLLMPGASMYLVRFDDGSEIALAGDNRYFEQLNSAGTLIGEFTEGSYITGPGFLSDLDGNNGLLQLLPGSSRAVARALADNGYSVGTQYIRTKVRGGWIDRPVPATYSPSGAATQVVLAYDNPYAGSSWMKLNEQRSGDTPMIAGIDWHAYSFWVRFPGFGAIPLTDLMPPDQVHEYEALRITDNGQIGESNYEFLMTTPRDSEGGIDASGAPSFYGEARRILHADGQPGYGGVYRIRPSTTP